MSVGCMVSIWNINVASIWGVVTGMGDLTGMGDCIEVENIKLYAGQI